MSNSRYWTYAPLAVSLHKRRVRKFLETEKDHLNPEMAEQVHQKFNDDHPSLRPLSKQELSKFNREEYDVGSRLSSDNPALRAYYLARHKQHETSPVLNVAAKTLGVAGALGGTLSSVPWNRKTKLIGLGTSMLASLAAMAHEQTPINKAEQFLEKHISDPETLRKAKKNVCLTEV